MKKQLSTILTVSLVIAFFTFVSPCYAAAADVTKIQTFIKSIIQVFVTIAGLVAAGFLVWGGIGYITSSGSPETLDRSKKTILYAGIGLAVVLGAFVLTNIITDLATGAFGAAQ